MVKVGILGANGRMGRVLIEAVSQHPIVELGFACVRASSDLLGVDAGAMAGVLKQNVTLQVFDTKLADQADVIVDFTLPSALEDNLNIAMSTSTPIVIGTTGLNASQLALIDSASKHIPVVFAANYSVGVNLMLNLVKTTARVMHETCDIEIIEAHHRFKKDAPSGTAMAIGESIAKEIGRDLSACAIYGREGDTGERNHQTIGFATVRAGDIVGEHTALFADLGEQIEITHKARSRLTFANGALKAACFLDQINKSGQSPKLYSMQSVLGLDAL